MRRRIIATSLSFLLILTACGSTQTDPQAESEVPETNPPEYTANNPETLPNPEHCEHNKWTQDHVCTVCGYVCEHEKWLEGVCETCGYICEHPSHDPETQLCTQCGEKVCHSFYHGTCACGALPDIREDYLDPAFYFSESDNPGTVEYLTYTARNYYYKEGPRSFDKKLLVYLPYGYNENEQYDVMLFIHGTGGTPEDFITREDDYYGPRPKVRGQDLYDYIFANKVAKPMILVAISVNGKLVGDLATEMSAEQIGQEIRKDILPCIIEHYSTYAQGSDEESIRAARQHFALCGISTGSIFAFDSGILQNFDLFGNYIVMSGGGKTYEAAEYINNGEWSDLPIYYFYSGAGTIDIRNLSALHTYQYMIMNTEELVEGENAMHVFVDGGHKWSVWFTELYNAMQLIFPESA